ncbi:hypothetical protein P154DRAFT_612566 [Amniculicola lignicola CBS 123094]|uniref:Osmotin, thaumatin-like protein n=1 Tax=Amniculicola lignicola CBS 123094 TaxID=1392246 RepID=A0A6A5W719_9PLEO|nr:hypothetical protein P154DRAFT_612566 [Amniculicola lignicola CBS 123094]
MLTTLLLTLLPMLTLSHPLTHGQPSPFKKLTPYPGKISVFNNCPQDFNLWSIPNPDSSTPITLPAGYVYIEHPRTGPNNTGGISIKITSSSADTLAAPHTQLEYTLADNKVWYDISFIDCVKKTVAGEPSDGSECPGHGEGVQVVGGGKCEMLACQGGEYCPEEAYFEPEGGYKPISPNKACGVEEGVAFELCAGLRDWDI